MQGRILGWWIWISVMLGLPLSPNAVGEPLETLSISSGERQHRFRVEIADSQAEWSRGLMYRHHLAADQGMLFVHPRPRILRMWMKNTLIPLDMLFVDRQGRIIHIARNRPPHSLEEISSGGEALAVLELAGGVADQLAIRPGDRIIHRAFSAKAPSARLFKSLPRP